MKAKYRKFTKKYCVWLRLKQTSGTTLQERSKSITATQKRKHTETDLHHNYRRRGKRLKAVLLGLSRAINNLDGVEA